MERIFGEKTCLLRRSSPYFDESFLGYIVRLTEINRYDTPSWILHRIGINNPLIGQGRSFVFSESPDVSPLCELINSGPEELTQLLCPPAGARGTFSQIMFGSVVPKRMIRIDRPKMCSECLRDSNYHRKIWDLAPVTACPVHRCFLLEECPNCTKKISWTRKNVSTCSCGYDWREASSTPAKDAELLLIREIYKRCGLRQCHSEVKLAKNNPLLHLNLEDMLVAVLFIGNQYSGINDTKGKHLTNSRKSKAIHATFVNGGLAFENWPHNYYEFLDWKRKQRDNSNLSANMKTDFGSFAFLLKEALSSKNFDFMRLAFEEYLKSRWDGGLLFKRALRLTKDSYDERKYISQDGVVRILHVASDAVKGLVKTGLLKPTAYIHGKDEHYLFDRDEVEELRRRIEQLVTAKEVAESLRIGRPKVQDLVRNKCLNMIEKFPESGFQRWRFGADEASKLLTAITHKIIKDLTSSKNDLISFNEAILRLCPSGIELDTLVRAILDEEISPRGKTRKRGLNQFLFNLRDIRKFAKRYRQNLKGTSLTVLEAAKTLGVKAETIYFFLTKKLLSVRDTHDVKRGLIISKEEIDRFNRSYVLAVNVARELGTSTRLLFSCLKEISVKPISGLKIDGGSQYLYKKSDLEDLNLADIVLKAKLQRDPRGQRHVTISREQACGALGIDRIALMEIVRCGRLKPYLQLVDKEQTYYLFLRTDVEKLRDENTDFSRLVSSQDAANMLGESYASFCGKWVNTKRLKPIKFKHIPNKYSGN